ncbi:Gmad2 immunoglobulin-like domain-containing protein [Nocardioides sp. B-3]|uniref:Gmad2 immunoglobulin-like domain-containing protein n=1 Tax=Nocardioides sp. B-3 TaxID=2895565 RepID=UPI002152A151|nr:Gmad2 immunoglobulin-like domain-containing protein [Nocardioides sp. B-3]UUZ58514.1 Gmad2 immunoglobulin-like domain-containing protein [Nocardioides sp. B-3]
MNLHELLTDAVADVEPRHALDEIRARTSGSRRRWPYAAAGAVLAVAASFAAFAVLGPDTAPTATDPGASTSASPSATASESAGPQMRAGAVYYIGETPDGLRLYREFAPVPVDNPLVGALTQVFMGDPQDPDYFTGWPPVDSTFLGAEVVDDVIRVEIGDPENLLEHDPPVEQYAMAIEQVIYTAQGRGAGAAARAVHPQRKPRQRAARPGDVGTARERRGAGDLGPCLADHAERGDARRQPRAVRGPGGRQLVRRQHRDWVEDLDGTVVVDQTPTIASGAYGAKLYPYEVTLDLTDVPPGDYLVVSSTDDPSGQNREHTDSRSITVVD